MLYYINVYRLFLIVAMVGKEAVEIDFERAAIKLFEADSAEKALFFFGFDRALVYSVVNSAEINEIESSSAENEESLKIVGADSGGDVVNESTLCGELELRHTAELVVNRCRVRQKIGLVFNAALFADLLLLGF